MIVVVGTPAWRDFEPPGPAGLACEIAVAAATRGRQVELVGRIGDDAPGDGLVIALAHAGVGHAAILRDPTKPTPVLTPPAEPEDPATDPGAAVDPYASAPRLEPADVSLALSYLTAFAVLVVTDDVPASALPAALDGAAFAGAHVVLLLAPGAPAPEGLPPASTVLGVPDAAEAGAFATVVGVYAEGLDAGLDPGRAFRAAIGDWEPADEGATSPTDVA
jgi:sugar/nucleoside kinase (ribokinase family)